MQGSLSNFAAGVLIIVFRPFKAGDVVNGGGVEGTVEEVPLAGILVGPEWELEGPFLDLAWRRAYRSVTLADDLTLFIPPARSNP